MAHPTIIHGKADLIDLHQLMATRKQKRLPQVDHNELFKRAINLFSDAILLLDRRRKIIFANSTTPGLLGVPRQGLLGKPLDRVLTLEDPSTRRAISTIPSTAQGPVSLLATVGDTVFTATAIDIRRTAGFNKLKSKATTGLFLRPSDLSLASAPDIHQHIIGQLTMRIAHDFNNSLTSMLGNAELVQEALEVLNAHEDNNPETPAGHAIPINRDVIRKCVEMAGFIHKLQDYARQQPTSRQKIDVNTTVQETLPITQKILGSRLTIDFKPGRDLPSIVADQAQLHQLLFTIFDNCKERAGFAQGTVTIQTSTETLDEHYASTHPGARPGEHLKLTVIDKGEPLSANSLPKAFNLFKSNETASNGLRLATVYAIVKQISGYIYVESDEIHGTRFAIYFPLQEDIKEVSPSPPPADKGKRPGNRTRRALRRAAEKDQLILIAEDQTDIQKTMIRYLSKAGYQTDVSSNGLDAWRRFQELNTNGNRPALVIADLGLPGIDGRTLCRKIKDSSPRMPVLLTSGHVVNLDTSQKRTVEGIPFIQKPFDASMLLRTINELLPQRRWTGGEDKKDCVRTPAKP